MADNEPLAKRTKQDDIETQVVSPDTSMTETGNINLLKEANDALEQSNKLHVRPIVQEEKLGIELFVGDRNDQFHGIIKTRYADFVVHEIDTDGNMAELTFLDPPEEIEPSSVTKIEDLIDGKAVECLNEVNSGYLTTYSIDVSNMDKDMRTLLHHAIRTSFDRLESSTVNEAPKPVEVSENGGQNGTSSGNHQQVIENKSTDEKPQDQATRDSTVSSTNTDKQNEKKFIVVTRRNKMSRPKNIWPKDRPDNTHFILYKENKDTMEAIYNLANSVNTRPSNFCSAGVKDRRAVTTQWLSCWRLEPRRLIGAVKRYSKPPFIKVGNFCFKKEPLRLGQLGGNKFNIVIRNLIHNAQGPSVISKSVDTIKEKGFINYFGLQRFGTRSIQTHEIGLAILQAQWESAVDLILSYRFDGNMHPLTTTTTTTTSAKKDKISSGDQTSGDSEGHTPTSENPPPIGRHKQESKSYANDPSQHNSFIDLWKSKLDAEIVFKKYPHFRYSNEGVIMKSLSKSEESSKDYHNAIISLPRNIRSMYVHSYQSLLWNKVVSYRLKTHGFKVIPGDLILESSSNVSDNSLDVMLSTDEAIELNSTNENEQKLNSKRLPIEEIRSKLVEATQDNIDKYTIFDVVLPIVGSRTKLPANDVGDQFRLLLEEDKLTLDSFKDREKFFISYGSYRKIMVKPKNVNWKLEQYSHPNQNLVETDIDRLINDKKLKDADASSKPSSQPVSDSSDEALIVEFELPPSAYATMCLREIMKKPSTHFDNRF